MTERRGARARCTIVDRSILPPVNRASISAYLICRPQPQTGHAVWPRCPRNEWWSRHIVDVEASVDALYSEDVGVRAVLMALDDLREGHRDVVQPQYSAYRGNEAVIEA